MAYNSYVCYNTKLRDEHFTMNTCGIILYIAYMKEILQKLKASPKSYQNTFWWTGLECIAECTVVLFVSL